MDNVGATLGSLPHTPQVTGQLSFVGCLAHLLAILLLEPLPAHVQVFTLSFKSVKLSGLSKHPQVSHVTGQFERISGISHLLDVFFFLAHLHFLFFSPPWDETLIFPFTSTHDDVARSTASNTKDVIFIFGNIIIKASGCIVGDYNMKINA